MIMRVKTMPFVCPLSSFLAGAARHVGCLLTCNWGDSTAEQRATFFVMLKDIKVEAEEEHYNEGGRIAVAIGVPHDFVDHFARAFQKADGDLFKFSQAQIDSYNRIVRFRNRRASCPSVISASAKLALDSALYAQPAVLIHRRWTVGKTRNLALIDSTTTLASAALLIKDMEGRPTILNKTEIPLQKIWKAGSMRHGLSAWDSLRAYVLELIRPILSWRNAPRN